MTDLQVVLDRVPFYDERSKDYPVRPLLAGIKRPRGYSWKYVQLDQNTYRCPICKQFGACTGFSCAMELAARPKPRFGDPLRKKFTAAEIAEIERLAHEAYHWAKRNDEWAGENYEGSSVLAAVKAGRHFGWWSEFRWALGPGAEKAAEDVVLTVGYKGPVIMGSWWKSGMWEADKDGYLHAEGRDEGGHAYLLTRARVRRGLPEVFTPNSWGGEGAGWLTFKDLVKLLAQDGEACVITARQ